MTRPRVYLGTIGVVHRKGFRWAVEDFLGETDPRLEAVFHGALKEIFALPPAPSAEHQQETDLCIDVRIPDYSSGMTSELPLLTHSIPLFWRPKVEIHARLYRLSNRRTVKTFAVTERPGWRDFVSSLSDWRVLLGRPSGTDEDEMEVLLNRASLRLLERIAAVAYK